MDAKLAAYNHFSSHDGDRLAYQVVGTGRPVVLLHGLLVSSMVNFATHCSLDSDGQVVASPGPTILEALIDSGHQAVLLDLRGHGYSDKPHDATAYEAVRYVNDMWALADHLDLDRFALVGYSLGAGLAARVIDRSDRLSAVVLGGITSDFVQGPDDDADEQWAQEWAALGDRFASDRWDDPPEMAFYPMLARLSPDPDFLALAAAARAVAKRIPQPLPKVAVPTLVLNGGSDMGAEEEHQFAKLIPGCENVVAGDGDHFPGAPSSPEFQRALVQFLVAHP